MPIAAADASSIETRIAALEARTGVQVVAMVARRSDAYPELTWMGFAMMSALMALAVVALDVLEPRWTSATPAISQSLAILGAGLLGSAASLWSEGVRRVLLSRVRGAGEVRQAAEAAFLARELHATPERTAILLYVSLFERHVEIVADTGYRTRGVERGWDAVIAAMTAELQQGHAARAFLAGLDALEEELLARGCASVNGGGNAFADRVIEIDAA